MPSDVHRRVSSPAIARQVARLMPVDARPHLGVSVRVASISSVTSAAGQEAGLPVTIEATEFTWQGILAAIVRWEFDELAHR